jgi:hypothetical protein
LCTERCAINTGTANGVVVWRTHSLIKRIEIRQVLRFMLPEGSIRGALHAAATVVVQLDNDRQAVDRVVSVLWEMAAREKNSPTEKNADAV